MVIGFMSFTVSSFFKKDLFLLENKSKGKGRGGRRKKQTAH